MTYICLTPQLKLVAHKMIEIKCIHINYMHNVDGLEYLGPCFGLKMPNS